MYVTFHQKHSASTEPVRMNCPACGERDVPSAAGQTVDYVRLLGLIPLLSLRATSIRCGKCRADVNCLASMQQMASMDAAALDPYLRWYSTPQAKKWSIAGLLTSVIPLVGLVIVSIALGINRGMRGWPSSVNMLSICFAVVSTIVCGLLLFMPT